MKALLKILFGLFGLALVVVIAVAVAVVTVDPNQHKKWIVKKAEEKTGRTLAIDGKIALEFYPWLGLEAEGVTVGNAKGFGPEPFLKLDHLKARIKLLPLLREQYEIDTVHLEGATLNLARNKEGVTNWADLSSGKSSGGAVPLTAIVLGGVDVQKARLNWNDATTGAHYVIKDLTATTGELTYGAPIDLALSFNGSANRPALNGDLKMKGVIAYDVNAGKYSIKPLDVNGTLRGRNVPGGQAPLSLSTAVDVDLDKDAATVSDLKLNFLQTAVAGRLDLSNLKAPQPSLKADLDAQGQDLAMLFKVFEVEPLAGQLAQLPDRGFTLKTKLDADMKHGDVKVPVLDARLLGAAIQGQLTATNAQTATPGVQGQISASGPDLPNVLQVLGQFQGGAKSRLSQLGRQLAETPDRSFNVNTTFDADMKGGNVNVPALSVKIAGATLEGHLKAGNVRTSTPSVQGSLNASGPDLPVLLRAAAGGGDPESALRRYGKQLSAMQNKAFAIKADFNADLKKGDVDLPALSIQTLGIVASGSLKAKDMESSDGSVSGQLSVAGEQLQDLLRALDQADLGQVLRSVKFDARVGGTRSNLNLKPMALNAVVASPEIKNSPVTIALNADTKINLDAHSLSLEDFTLKGLGLNVQGDVRAEKIDADPQFSGHLAVGEFNPRQLLVQLKQKPPQTTDKDAFQKVALNADFSGSRTTLSLSRLTLKMDQTNLKGDLAVENAQKRTVRFGFDVDELDADRYLPPQPEDEQPQAAKGKKKGKLARTASAAASLPVDMLRTLDVDGRLAVGKFRVSDVQMTDVKMALKGKDGVLKLTPIDAKLYGGTHAGDISMDVTGKVPRLALNSRLEGVQAEPLLKDMTGEAKLKGVGNFSAALVAAGTTPDEMKQTLNGQMSFTLKDAALKGYNLGKILRMGNSLKENFSLNVSDQEQTDLSDVTGNPVAQNGVIRMDDLSGKSPGLRLTGKGVLADLPRDQIDYKITANVVATSKGTGGKDLQEGKLEGVPLDCTIKGSLEAPKRDCDASKLLAALGVKILQGVLTAPGQIVPGVSDLTGGAGSAVGGAAAAVGAAGAAAAGALGGLLGGDKSGGTKDAATAPKEAAPATTTTAPAPKSATTATPKPATTTAPKSTTTTAPKSATTTAPKSTTTAPKSTTTTQPKGTTTTAPKSAATTAPKTSTTAPKTAATTAAPKAAATAPDAATATPKDATTDTAAAKKKKKAAKGTAADTTKQPADTTTQPAPQ